MAEEAQSPTVTVETSYRTKQGEQTETYELDNYEVERLLEQMLRGSVDSVDARVIANELKARQ
jgi:hypothetical protein